MNRAAISMFWVFCLLLSTIAAAHTGKEDNNKALPEGAGVHLKFNFKPGDKYLFVYVVKQEIVQEAMGQQITTTNDLSTDYLYTVTARENGITEIEVTINALKMDTDVGGMQRITFDSDHPDAGTNELKIMSTVVGKAFRLYVNEDGSTHKVVGFAEIFGALEGAQAEILKQSFGDSSLVQSMNQISNIYPNKSVSVGDTWIKASAGSIANLMHSDINSDFTLSELEGDIAVLNVDSRLTFSKLAGEGSNPMLQAAAFDMSGTQRGTIEVDIKSGLPILSKLNQDIVGSMNFQGMTIPMTITSNITVTGEKL